MKWLLLLLWNPVEALDLRDKSGAVDHGKIVGFFSFMTILCVLFLYVIDKGRLLPLGHTIALISTAYGWAGWRAFLASKAATSREKLEIEQRDIEERHPFGAPTYIFDDD
jgi:hypothetical protein